MPENSHQKKDARNLANQLRNVGPAMAGKMLAAGIVSAEELRAIGAKQAFLKMYPAGDNYGDYNAAYLYALEGAIRDCDWSEVPANVRTDLQQFAQELQKGKA